MGKKLFYLLLLSLLFSFLLIAQEKFIKIETEPENCQVKIYKWVPFENPKGKLLIEGNSPLKIPEERLKDIRGVVIEVSKEGYETYQLNSFSPFEDFYEFELEKTKEVKQEESKSEIKKTSNTLDSDNLKLEKTEEVKQEENKDIQPSDEKETLTHVDIETLIKESQKKIKKMKAFLREVRIVPMDHYLPFPSDKFAKGFFFDWGTPRCVIESVIQTFGEGKEKVQIIKKRKNAIRIFYFHYFGITPIVFRFEEERFVGVRISFVENSDTSRFSYYGDFEKVLEKVYGESSHDKRIRIALRIPRKSLEFIQTKHRMRRETPNVWEIGDTLIALFLLDKQSAIFLDISQEKFSPYREYKVSFTVGK